MIYFPELFFQQLYLIKTSPFTCVWDFLLFSTDTIKFPTQMKYFIRDYHTEAVPPINSPSKFLLKERDSVPCGYGKTSLQTKECAVCVDSQCDCLQQPTVVIPAEGLCLLSQQSQQGMQQHSDTTVAMLSLFLGNMMQLLSISSFSAKDTFLFPDWTASITEAKEFCVLEQLKSSR